MASLPIYWNRCKGDVWGELYAVDLDDPHFDELRGVYMVWLGGSKPAAMCAGSGLIREKLAEAREAPEVAALREKSLLVSWARVDGDAAKGVERWLIETLHPRAHGEVPDASPIAVNLPGRPGQAPADAGDPPGQIAARPSKPEPAAAAPPVSVRAPSLQSELAELARGPKDEKLAEAVAGRIIKEAVKLGASAVHFEPMAGLLRVRLRVDGVLEPPLELPPEPSLRLIRHLRAACGLEGTGKAEEGRMAFSHDGGELELALSIFPALGGDSAVLRIPGSSKLAGLDALGLAPKIEEALRELSARPRGLILATGPAGSGRTTTLYALLKTLNSPSREIVTIEDPVERAIPGVNQGAIRPGFGFADGIRAALHQDPDLILVGDLRDCETAELSASASASGRMVLAGMQSGGAMAAVARLLDMGLDAALLASALTAVSCQRLARAVCRGCAEPREPDAAEVAELDRRLKSARIMPPDGLLKSLKRGAGCAACRRTGFSRRVPLFELVAITPALRAAIQRKAPLDELRAAALKEGAVPLLSDGLRLAGEGAVPLSEVFRVVDSAD